MVELNYLIKFAQQNLIVGSYFSSEFRLGILGGGQLGKMLLGAAQRYDIYTCVLDADKQGPCATLCNEFYQGDVLDEEAVYNFGKRVDVLTIEIEHVNVKALYRLENKGIKVYPQAHVIQTIQDKSKQKEFCKIHQIPSADYIYFETLQHLKEALPEFPFVWKSTRFGYDGMGVRVINGIKDLENLPNTSCIAERKISFKKEIAVMVARNKRGKMINYPVVEMGFHPVANQVEYVICPANISEKVQQKAVAMTRKISETFDYIGLMAVEMFVTKTDDILVNEIAPRVHNSGHYSIEASYTSQFEQHLRAILNLPLGSADSKSPAVMVNLVGDKDFRGKVCYQNIEETLSLKGVYPHIYGKKQTKPFRKMGHVTVVHEDVTKALQVAKKIKKTLKVTGDIPVV